MEPVAVQGTLRIVIEHCRAGRLSEGESLCRQAMAQQPENALAMHILGMIVGQLGRTAEAIELIGKAIVRQPDNAMYHWAMGDFCAKSGKWDDAAAAFARTVALDSTVTDAYFGLGHSRMMQGRVDDAIAAFRQAVSLRPDFAEAYSNLGHALCRRGLIDAAAEAHARAVQLKPAVAGFHNNLGVLLRDQGRFDQALASLNKAISLAPDYAMAYNNLGNTLRSMIRMDEAITAYTRAVELKPDAADILTNLGNALRDQGRLDEAITAHTKAIELQPNYGQAHNNLAGAMISAGRLDEGFAGIRRALEVEPGNPNNPRIASNLVYLLHFHADYDGPQILEEHRKWAAQYAEPLAAELRPHDNDTSPNRRLRIGYISSDFRGHPVGRFLSPLFSHHDRSKYEIICYSSVTRPDDLTRRLQSHADRWRQILTMPYEAVAQQIRSDRIDVLVDLSLHMTNNYMLIFARKPAPVQMTWLGYASTTGLATMDYRLSDPYLDPPGIGDENYVEETIRLPRCFWCYEVPDWIPQVNPLPALKAGRFTFGCFNNFCKVTLPTQHLWAKLLQAIPNSRLLIHSREGCHLDDVRRRFTDAGIDPARLEFMGFTSMDKYFSQYHQVDVALDPFPYGGGTTTCDALAMGVPVVTLAGRTAVGRAGVSLLSNLGLTELIASTPEEYISIARRLADNLPKLAELRSGLRPRMSASLLTDGKQFAAEMEATYRQAWKKWCSANV